MHVATQPDNVRWDRPMIEPEILVPVALGCGMIGLAALVWWMGSGGPEERDETTTALRADEKVED
jgi:nitrogen fixation-related uncharacterized protein